MTPGTAPDRTPSTPKARHSHTAAPAASVLTAVPSARAWADLPWHAG